jgi:hypothetical protein
MAYWKDVALMALGPVLAGWLLVYEVVWIVQWVRSGFSESKELKYERKTEAQEVVVG